jgi:hypothetical protein
MPAASAAAALLPGGWFLPVCRDLWVSCIFMSAKWPAAGWPRAQDRIPRLGRDAATNIVIALILLPGSLSWIGILGSADRAQAVLRSHGNYFSFA